MKVEKKLLVEWINCLIYYLYLKNVIIFKIVIFYFLYLYLLVYKKYFLFFKCYW